MTGNHMIVFTNYSKEIGRRKSVKKGLLPVVKDVADRIMGSQMVNLMGCIKLPDG